MKESKDAGTAAAEPVCVLVAEDDEELLDLIRRVLSDDGYRVVCAGDGAEAMALLDGGKFDVVLTDIRMPGPDGMAILRRAIAKRLHQPVILMTAFGSVESAVQAMREGAHHYLAKPFDIEDLVEIVGTAARQIRQLREVGTAGPAGERSSIVFRSRAMSELLTMARDVAGSSATVLVSGSSGTGKELVSRAIHRLSQRQAAPFIAVDCNAIPESLLESELFGHRRGAFSGAVSDKAGIIEQADSGTLFIDEVGNLSPAIQAKLLRFLQERSFRRVGDAAEQPVNIRLISATNQDLRGMVQKGTFREDLYYRLSVIHLKIPELKDRREDITPLVYHFIRKFNEGYQVEGIRPDALDILTDCPWPGNVRQLENVVERAVILRKAGLIQPRDLPEEIVGIQGGGGAAGRTLEETERRYIQQLLEECGGNQSRVARILGINRRTLYRKLRKFGDDGSEEQ